MKSEDHLFIGRYLSTEYLSSEPVLYRRMFIAGGILPDINLLSYFRGIMTTGRLKGHNYENSKEYVRRLSQKLCKRCKYNMLDWLKLGELIHYTADAFTFVHNKQFEGNLKEHIEYEKNLHLIFRKYFEEVRTAPQVYTDGAESFEYISELHRKYTGNAYGFINDIESIYEAVHVIMNTYISSKGKVSVYYRSAA